MNQLPVLVSLGHVIFHPCTSPAGDNFVLPPLPTLFVPVRAVPDDTHPA